MEQIVYIDMENLKTQNVIAMIITDDTGNPCTVVHTGKQILSMPRSDYSRFYETLAKDFDVHFIFDDAEPEFSWYPIPSLIIFATDHLGGAFGSTNGSIDIQEQNAPVYYIHTAKECYYLAANLREFLELIIFHQHWKVAITGESPRATATCSKEVQKLIQTLHLGPHPKNQEIYLPQEIEILNSYTEAKEKINFYDVAALIEQDNFDF